MDIACAWAWKWAWAWEYEHRLWHGHGMGMGLPVALDWIARACFRLCEPAHCLCPFRFGIDAKHAQVHLREGARDRLLGRICHDVSRLGMDPKYLEPLTALLEREECDRRALVSTLVIATRLAAQPKRSLATSVRSHSIVWPSIVVLISPFFGPIPHRPAYTASGTPLERLVWLYPPHTCPCDISCDARCDCVSADWSDILLLACLLFTFLVSLSQVTSQAVSLKPKAHD